MAKRVFALVVLSLLFVGAGCDPEAAVEQAKTAMAPPPAAEKKIDCAGLDYSSRSPLQAKSKEHEVKRCYSSSHHSCLIFFAGTRRIGSKYFDVNEMKDVYYFWIEDMATKEDVFRLDDNGFFNTAAEQEAAIKAQMRTFKCL